MYGQSGDQRIAATFATGTTASTAAIDVRGANRIAIEIGTFASAMSIASSILYIQGSSDTSGPFRRVMTTLGAGSASDWATVSFAGNRTVICDAAPGFSYVKVELANVTTAPLNCWVHKLY